MFVGQSRFFQNLSKSNNLWYLHLTFWPVLHLKYRQKKSEKLQMKYVGKITNSCRVFWAACDLVAGIAFWIWYSGQVSFWKGLVPDLHWIYRVEVLSSQNLSWSHQGESWDEWSHPSPRVWPSRTLLERLGSLLEALDEQGKVGSSASSSLMVPLELLICRGRSELMFAPCPSGATPLPLGQIEWVINPANNK